MKINQKKKKIIVDFENSFYGMVLKVDPYTAEEMASEKGMGGYNETVDYYVLKMEKPHLISVYDYNSEGERFHHTDVLLLDFRFEDQGDSEYEKYVDQNVAIVSAKLGYSYDPHIPILDPMVIG